MWMNVIRVRTLCQLAWGYDPIIEGADQKPLHFNEAGSKCKKTLTFANAPDVPLRENVSASRDRFTAMTYVTSSRERFPQGLPLEVCFKGGEQVKAEVREHLQQLLAAWRPVPGLPGTDVQVTVTTSKSGSYKETHALDFLEAHLDAWSPGRDWRILLLLRVIPRALL